MEHLRGQLDGMGCGVLVHGEDGRVVDANPAASRMTRLTRAQLVGDAPPDPGWCAVEESGIDGLNHPLPLTGLGRRLPRAFVLQVTSEDDATPTWIRGGSAPLPGAGARRRALSTLVDVSEERGRAEAARAQAGLRLERLQALRNAALAMNASHDLRLTLNVIAQLVMVHFGVSAAAIALLEDDDMLSYAAGAGFRRSGITRTRLALGEGYLGRSGLELRRVGVPDLRTTADFRRHKLLEGEDFVAYVAVPLVTRSHLVGVLELFNRGPLDEEPEWQEFVETLAEHAASAIDSARLRERLRSAGRGRPARGHGRMTQMQEAILRLLARGLSSRDIASRVFLSENTVKFHLRHIYRALDVHSRAEAVAEAASRGWL
jgi:DNA-binding CsgD family transcriptional regulator